MRNFFGYIRVSDPKQGKGVSLQEQKDAILRHCQRNGLDIVAWFEERETAAKRGRPVFTQMLNLLKRGNAQGVVIHKIDRSARNLKDWADLGELIDTGIEVHFANESLDLHSRGGRLSADIQAVVAADYIRNLREETRKGFYGRIKQGVYPLPAPLGYIDKGKGEPKQLDPVKAPLVRKVFELYASGRYNLDTLVDEMWRLGLRNRNNNKVTRNGLSVILNNPFYIGLVRLKKTGETFAGIHPQLVSKSLFDRVQEILSGKTNTRVKLHNFLFRRLLSCARCRNLLTGEEQKGHVYYRCHTSGCTITSVREEAVEEEAYRKLWPLQFDDQEKDHLEEKVLLLRNNWETEQEAQIKGLNLTLNQLQDRLGRLTDAFLDGTIEKELFEERKAKLLMERKDLEENLALLKQENYLFPNRLREFFELAGGAYYQYKMGFQEEKRDLLKIVTSNRIVEGKRVDFTLSSPFDMVANRLKYSNGSPQRDTLRTWDELLPQLIHFFKSTPSPDPILGMRLPESYFNNGLEQGGENCHL